MQLKGCMSALLKSLTGQACQRGRGNIEIRGNISEKKDLQKTQTKDKQA